MTGPEYLTAHARWLGDHPVTGSAGAVLTMPSKESMYVYPIDGAEVVRALTVLAHIAAAHLDDPWAINPHIYWWRAGRLDLAATTHREGHTLVSQLTPAFHHNTTTFDDTGPATE
ncbi:hypothetical protein [Nocardia panacis]|uniref:hypothetical protein n=1 Tax=Nocardia panacis TaxID=2340916 RepID=UPI0011C3F2BC|nr:hypothetical protein [Nocardia panacis]